MTMNRIVVYILAIVLLFSCKEDNYYPKPLGNFRIGFPEKIEYKDYESECNFSYQYPSFSAVLDKGNCNQNIVFPKYNAILHLTSIKFDGTKMNNLFYHSEYSRKLAYEHRIKADAINQTVYVNDSARVYGVTYEILGNVASNYQFYLTDSTDTFFRGSLYFNVKPNIDSIKPVLDFLKGNINNMIETFDWK
jgi:gliding motility-associated lipoprotein GldD